MVAHILDMHAFAYIHFITFKEMLLNGCALKTTIVLIWYEWNSILENITIHREIALKTKKIVAKLFACTFHTSCKFVTKGLFFKLVLWSRTPERYLAKVI